MIQRLRPSKVDIYIVVIREYDALELRIGINVDVHRMFFALLKQQRERPEKFRHERGFDSCSLRCRFSALCIRPRVLEACDCLQANERRHSHRT